MLDRCECSRALSDCRRLSPVNADGIATDEIESYRAKELPQPGTGLSLTIIQSASCFETW